MGCILEIFSSGGFARGARCAEALVAAAAVRGNQSLNIWELEESKVLCTTGPGAAGPAAPAPAAGDWTGVFER